mmetsp:Transcript_107163/g.169203  ORF Transcript_107163/g.169203 Transcript_107163/m.169203 type:complete len:84 (-) Transcript_107163:77-328(-)
MLSQGSGCGMKIVSNRTALRLSQRKVQLRCSGAWNQTTLSERRRNRFCKVPCSTQWSRLPHELRCGGLQKCERPQTVDFSLDH